MKNKFNKSERGFTIIEVVLVLAIGGLIFMVVFLALPGLQANQRDTQRKQVLGDAASAIVTYQSNHKGKLPAGPTMNPTFKDWVSASSSFAEPRTGDEYNVQEITTDMSAMTNMTDKIIYFARVNGSSYPACQDDGRIIYQVTKKNSFAITVLLDSGKQMYCQAS